MYEVSKRDGLFKRKKRKKEKRKFIKMRSKQRIENRGMLKSGSTVPHGTPLSPVVRMPRTK